jgi:hypothetical protein
VKLDRAARLQQAKAIGWTAYRLVRAAKIEGYIEIDDGRKLVRGPATGQRACLQDLRIAPFCRSPSSSELWMRRLTEQPVRDGSANRT